MNNDSSSQNRLLNWRESLNRGKYESILKELMTLMKSSSHVSPTQSMFAHAGEGMVHTILS